LTTTYYRYRFNRFPISTCEQSAVRASLIPGGLALLALSGTDGSKETNGAKLTLLLLLLMLKPVADQQTRADPSQYLRNADPDIGDRLPQGNGGDWTAPGRKVTSK